MGATPATQWKGRTQTDASELTLPSENVALVRQISPQAFVTSGMIPDPLSAIIQKAISEKRGLPPSVMKKIENDPDMLVSALELFDRVLSYVVVEPAISMPPSCEVELDDEKVCGVYANTPIHTNPETPGYHRYKEGPRDADILYADQVDLNDKVFIFQWCLGGTRDLEKFRGELAASMAGVSNSKVVQRKAKSTSRRK